ncbi:U2 small nuclear ribonucleoprotein auxiliary factor 35 kDa subunit-related protein 1-like isoform X2 [Brienomyrus brachyistius]|uniref:U2 small nuclear ribonucleoprotein auxiliary factor 35 kDa subunit-related protein 1-like isoform X2 n=1 Tax=Brienomyrus brachyistius TaxID=42636 RepID=UPI0020B2EC27|nr:U2 small nuclear ribonucleoprotein auxiliary factor 35 kDa subunit-related protein 1-like isoform X2 [Brienomyrus brachyistius]
MSHAKRFEDIPMSKAMRGICKEEDYAFLGKLDKSQNQSKDTKCMEDEWRGKYEDRVRRREEREKKELERLRQIEEMRKEREQQWKEHVAALAVKQEATVKERAVRLRDFRLRKAR